MERKNPLPLPEGEKERLAAVLDYDVLNTEYEKDLDDLTAFAANLFNVPIVLVTILDEKRQWFKSNYGMSVKETERSISFCQYTILQKDIFEVENAVQDERFSENPLVLEKPNIRFYAGIPLINERGFAIGSLALIDQKPRKLSTDEKNVLNLLGKQVLNFFELTMKKKELEKEKTLLEKHVDERTAKIKQQLVELEKRDNQLISLNSELTRFIYKLSHDLLGPLKSLQGLINLSLQEAKQPEIRHYLTLMQKTESKLDNTLISLIKIISIKDPWDISIIRWEHVIRNAIKNARKRVPEKDVDCKLDITVEKEFKSDKLLLEMMIEEFLVNSMQFNFRPDPVIQIRIKEIKDHILVEISDNGIGIREEEKDKIFEMFYKSEKSLGSGLGLYIAKNMVEKLGGSIRLETEKNKGSKFRILIPYTPPGLS